MPDRIYVEGRSSPGAKYSADDFDGLSLNERVRLKANIL